MRACRCTTCRVICPSTTRVLKKEFVRACRGTTCRVMEVQRWKALLGRNCDLCAKSFQTRTQFWLHTGELRTDKVQEWRSVNSVLKVFKQEVSSCSMESYYMWRTTYRQIKKRRSVYTVKKFSNKNLSFGSMKRDFMWSELFSLYQVLLRKM